MRFTTDWFSDHIPDWKKHLSVYKDKSPLNFLEVGTFEGRSATWLLDNILTHENSKIFCCDTWEGSPEHEKMNVSIDGTYERFMKNVKPYGNRVVVLKGKSQQMLRLLPYEMYDFAYIDGSHTASDVLEDSVLVWGLVKPGGIICWDDYFWSHFSNRLSEDGVTPDENKLLQEPRMAIDAFLRIFNGKYELLAARDQVWIKKL